MAESQTPNASEGEAYEPRMKTIYRESIRATMKEKFGYTNEMQIPKLDKIVLNMGVGEATADSKKVNSAIKDLSMIAGQKPAPTRARLSIAKRISACVSSVSTDSAGLASLCRSAK